MSVKQSTLVELTCGKTVARKELIQLIASAVNRRELPSGFILSDEAELRKIAEQHDMNHIVGRVVSKNHLSSNESQYTTPYFQAVRRVAMLDCEVEKIKRVLEENSIDFIFLKGAVFRELYPERWMRVSSDVDVLVREEDLDKAIEVLSSFLAYEKGRVDSHDVLLIAPNALRIELHYCLTMRDWKAKVYLDEVWSRSRPIGNLKHEYVMQNDFLYLYHIFHTAKHFHIGGCGIRAIADTWILNHSVAIDQEKRKYLLEKSNLLTFATAIESISEKWFTLNDTQSFDEIEDYILEGGVFGKNQVIAAKQAKKGGHKKYLLYRLFPSFSSMKDQYPFLKKLPILLPVCWIVRLVKSFLRGKYTKAINEYEQSKEDTEKSRAIADIFKRIGLE